MNYIKTSDTEALQTGIVIIGRGGGGLTAAVAAAEKGAKVMVLEKRDTAGGNVMLANGIFAAESPVQKRKRIDASLNELFKTAITGHLFSRSCRVHTRFCSQFRENSWRKRSKIW